MEVFPVQIPNHWMTPILNYLHSGELLVDHNEARKLRLRASWFVLINEVLYKRGFAFPYLGCLMEDEANYALHEIYEGICGDHSGARPFASEVLRTGYYWLTVQKDAFAFVQASDKCQWFANIIKVPAEELTHNFPLASRSMENWHSWTSAN